MGKQLTTDFHSDLKALRDKYPTHYIEAWTPDDYQLVCVNAELTEADHIDIAIALYEGFDATVGTTWDRIEIAVATAGGNND